MTLKRTENITCDGDKCDHVRDQDANHWLVGLHVDKTIMVSKSREMLHVEVTPLPDTMKGSKVMFAPYNNVEAFVKDFCGEECAIKWVSKMLTEIKR